jgi:hypothetical protein
VPEKRKSFGRRAPGRKLDKPPPLCPVLRSSDPALSQFWRFTAAKSAGNKRLTGANGDGKRKGRVFNPAFPTHSHENLNRLFTVLLHRQHAITLPDLLSPASHQYW